MFKTKKNLEILRKVQHRMRENAAVSIPYLVRKFHINHKLAKRIYELANER